MVALIKHNIHKYMKVNGKESVIYRCMEPGCSHWIRSIFIVNRIAKCWYCGNNFIITKELARLTKPHCDNCTNKKVKPVKPSEANEFLTELGDEDDKLDKKVVGELDS